MSRRPSISSFLHAAMNLRPPSATVSTHTSAYNAVAFHPAMPNARMSFYLGGGAGLVCFFLYTFPPNPVLPYWRSLLDLDYQSRTISSRVDAYCTQQLMRPRAVVDAVILLSTAVLDVAFLRNCMMTLPRKGVWQANTRSATPTSPRFGTSTAAPSNLKVGVRL